MSRARRDDMTLDEAERVFEKLLWLSPSDNRGIRFLLEDVRPGKAWAENQEGR